MKLRDLTLERLAGMVVGDNSLFVYRSSYWITQFFTRCGMSYIHGRETRGLWTKEVLKELNQQPEDNPELPSPGIIRVITELFDDDDFDRAGKSKALALEDMNKLFARDHLAVYLDDNGYCFVRNTGTGVVSARPSAPERPLSKDEIIARDKISNFLKNASEDEFTEKLLVPFFQRHNFKRVSPGGHSEKHMEFGKDMWMKYLLPTGHWIYFCAQIKKGKIDSSGTGGLGNVTEILNQARMAIDNPIFDPDVNRKVLLDHMYIIAGGDITRPARQWLIERLDKEQRRKIIFMDKAEFLDRSARILQDLHLDEQQEDLQDDDLPF